MGDHAMDDEQIKKLQHELEEAQEALRALRQGEVDALVVDGANGPQVFSLKTAEQPYRMLVEQMQEGAVALTPARDVLYCNRGFAQMVGLEPEQIVGGSIDRFIAPTDSARLAERLRARRGRYEGHLVTADGRQVPAYLSVGTFVADGVESLCLVVTDLLELTHTRAAAAEAEAASRAKDEFIAMLSHELRNPLGAISAAISLLNKNEPALGPSGRARAVITRQTEHLSRLIEDLLEVTRSSLGKIMLERSAIDVAETVRRCITALESVAKLEGHALTVEAESVWVDADPTRIEQVAMNLLSNAAKFTPRGGTIRVEVRRENDEAVLRVADSGAGITPEFLPLVFDLFAQGEKPLDRPAGGLGVGLTLVRRLVELHGGRVEAASPGPGRGSVFTVRLPALAGQPKGHRRSSEAPAVCSKKRILIIEDDADNREMMRILLESSGHEVHDAAAGASGIELASRLEPEVVLIDIGLPGLDGYEVARRIRAVLGGRPRLVALSGYGQPEDKQRAFAAGFDDHLVKPADPARLATILATPPGTPT
jgi:PAS domain S-box-containing protein